MERICLVLGWDLLEAAAEEEAAAAEETSETTEPPKMRRSRGGFFNGHRSVLDGLLGVLIALLPTTIALSQPRQSPTPTFRTGIEQIEVSVIARDGSGKFVSDLTMEDFEIFEDGKRQQLNDIVLIDLPVVTAPPAAMT